jgi:uncharacterized protein HemY
LALAIDDPAQGFQSSFNQAAALLTQAEVHAPDVVRCLILAIERADKMGFPDRAAQMKQLAAVASTQPGSGDADVKLS